MKTYLSSTTLVTLLFAFILMSCNGQEDIETVKGVQYLALGDSYTIGQGVDETQRWPNQLSKRLNEHNIEVAETKIIAQTGWTTNNLLKALEEEDVEGYNLVSLLIGVNNQFQNLAFSVFETEFNTLLNQSIEIAGNKDNVFVLSIPDYGVTPFGSSNSLAIGQDIDRYNDYIQFRCLEEDIYFIDITEISRQMADLPGSLATDNLHPSASQYTKWTEATFPVVEEILRE